MTWLNSSPKRRRLWIPLLLLAPTFAIMLYTFVVPLISFMRFSFYSFRRGRLEEDFSFDAYVRFLTDPYYHTIILDTLELALSVTVLSLIIGYPIAYALWRLNRPGLQRWLGLIIFSPILVSVVVRSYGWTVFLADQGPVNYVIQQLGITSGPVALVFNFTGVLIALVHVFLPFVVFPIYASMVRLDPSLKEAAEDLGAEWWFSFRKVTFPLTLPGFVAGAQICFTLALGAFVTTSILGGGRVTVLPLQIYQSTADINWPIAAVGGFVLVLLSVTAVMLSNRLLKYSGVA